MQIDELTPIDRAITSAHGGAYLSTKPGTASISSFTLHPSSFLFIGPEGGWTDEEIAAFEQAGLTGVKLTATILRVETAAVAAAAILACFGQSSGDSSDSS
jgi:16S rRNA (uracil1498-N3)-methyltransferase